MAEEEEERIEEASMAHSIAKFPEALHAKILEKRLEAEQALEQSPYRELEEIKVELLKDFSTDLEIAIGELRQHDRHVYRVKHKIFRRTTELLRNSDRLKLISILFTVIGLIGALVEIFLR